MLLDKLCKSILNVSIVPYTGKLNFSTYFSTKESLLSILGIVPFDNVATSTEVLFKQYTIPL